MFIMELMARIIMRDDLNDSETLYIDLDRKFTAFKLIEICTKMLDEEFRDSPDCVKKCVKPKMKKVQIITVEEFNELIFINIEFHLKKNPRISLVLIDSLGEFVEASADSDSDSTSDVGNSKKKKDENIETVTKGFPISATSSDQSSVDDVDVSTHLERLKQITEKFQVCIVSAVPSFVDVRDEIADIKVELTKVKEQAFHMNINDSKEVAFTIGFYGIQTADPPPPQIF